MNSENIFASAVLVVNFAQASLLTIYVLRDKLKWRAARVAAAAGALILVLALIFYFISLDRLTFSLYIVWTNLMIVPIFTFFFLLTNEKKMKAVYFFSVIIVLASIVTTSSNSIVFIYYNYFYFEDSVYRFSSILAVNGFASVVTTLPLLLYMRRLVKNMALVAEVSREEFWKLMWIIPAFFYFLNVTFNYVFDTENVPIMLYAVANAVTAAGIIIVSEALLLILRSITQRAEQEKLIRREADAAKEAERQLTAQVETISHEAQGPLGALSNFARFVALEIKEKGQTEQTASVLHRIEHEASRVAKLIDTLSEAAPQTKDEHIKVNFDISELIKRAADIYRPMFEARGVKLLTETSDGLMVFGNPDEINRVLTNLLSNAGNHTVQGTVDITAERKSENGRTAAVTVKDTGRGIAKERLTDVFGRGETTTPGGRGIGLFVCKQIIAAHGGEIVIESTEGEGTAVIFTLPVAGRKGD